MAGKGKPGRRARVLALVLSLGTALLIAPPLWAQSPEPAPPEPAPVIASTVDDTADSDIAERIRGIFGQIDGLGQVQVEVSSGVVTLAGTVTQQGQIEQAGAIASRVDGVVTVQNDLQRDVAVETNVAPVLEKLKDDARKGVQALPLLLIAVCAGLLVALAGFWLANRKSLWKRVTRNVFLADLIASSIRIVATVAGALITLQILDASALVGAVLGGAGVIGIALGFAMRDTVDNYVSSVMLSLRQPFRANDHVVIEGKEGRVIRLTSRATILMTLDGNHLRIPNATVFKSVILNYTRNPQRRFQFDLGVDADDDAIAAMQKGVDAVKGLSFVLNDPEPNATIENVGDSNIVLRFFGWVDQRQTDFNKGRSLAIQTAKMALEANGFSLPEPIYRLRFDASMPPPPAVTSDGKRRKVRKAPDKPSASQAESDTRPEPAVEKMVRDERQQTSDDADLLSDNTPME